MIISSLTNNQSTGQNDPLNEREGKEGIFVFHETFIQPNKSLMMLFTIILHKSKQGIIITFLNFFFINKTQQEQNTYTHTLQYH